MSANRRATHIIWLVLCCGSLRGVRTGVVEKFAYIPSIAVHAYSSMSIRKTMPDRVSEVAIAVKPHLFSHQTSGQHSSSHDCESKFDGQALRSSTPRLSSKQC